MANVSFEMKVSGPIYLDSFSMNSIKRIMDFIEHVKAEENGTTVQAPETGTKTGEAKSETKKTKVTPEKSADKFAKVGRYKGFEKIVWLFKDAEAHPDDYTWESMMSLTWKSAIPALKEIPDHSVSHVLGSMVKLGITEKRVEKNAMSSLPENFYRVPVPKTCDVEKDESQELVVKPEDKRLGDILRKSRVEHGLSVVELSRGIGYDAGIIVKWETGVYHMAATAIRAICEFFKENIFANATEESA